MVVAQQGREADDRPAGVGDEHDVLTPALVQPLDALDEPRPDRRGLRLVVEDHGQVAEPVHDEHVGHRDLHPFSDRPDRDRVERRVDPQDGEGGRGPDDAEQRPDDRLLPDAVEEVGDPPATAQRQPDLVHAGLNGRVRVGLVGR